MAGSKGRYGLRVELCDDPLVTHGQYVNDFKMHHDKMLHEFTLFYVTQGCI